MPEFAYNNSKNASTDYTPLELNYGYHSWMLYEEDVDPRSQFKLADKLLAKLRDLIIISCKNLYHAQEFQRQAHDKGVKLWCYALGKKVWLNSKYIKTKHNRNLEIKFFGPFWVLHSVGKQAYKLELPKIWRIHDVFHVSLLKQDITRKERIDVNNVAELDTGDNSGKYKIEAIWDNTIYVKESESGHLPGLYYLVSWKRYPEE